MRTTITLLPLLAAAATAFRPATTLPALGAGTSPSALLGVLGDGVDEVGDAAKAASRRSFLARSLASVAGASVLLPPASYAEDSVTPYEDSDFGFKFSVPANWETTEQKLSGRRRAVFFTDPASKDADSGTVETFGFVAYTPVRDDFTTLGSFGSVDEVAQTTILPKGELAGLEDASKMLSAVSKNNAYYFDYVATPVVPSTSGSAMTKTLKKQHFRTIFTLLPLKNSAGMTLVTITLQTTEERYGGVKGMFDGVVDSYGKL